MRAARERLGECVAFSLLVLLTSALFAAVHGQGDAGGGIQPPTVTIQSGSVKSVYPEDTLTADLFQPDCLITGTYTSAAWWRNGVTEVINKTRSLITGNFNLIRLVLRSRTLARSDSGWYECRAYDRSSQTVVTASDNITFLVAVTPKIVSVPSSPVTVLHDNPLRLSCQAEGYQVSVNWTQPKTATPHQTSLALSADSMSATGTLTVPRAVWNETAGTYSCVIGTSAICNNTGFAGGNGTSLCKWKNPNPLSRSIDVIVNVNLPGKCRSFKASRMLSRTATLSWLLPSDQGSTSVNMFVLLCSSQRADSSVVMSINHSIPLPSAQPSTYLVEHNVSGLWPFSTISCNVSASNPGGGLGPAVNVQFSTLEATPEGKVIFSFSQRNTTAIYLPWMPPEIPLQHGVILSYKISFVAECSGCRDCCEEATCTTTGNQTTQATGPSAESSVTATGLCHFTSYGFNVQACNSIGCGPSSLTYAKTDEAIPSPPAVTATAINVSTIVVSWKTPTPSTYGPVRQYTVTPSSHCSCCCEMQPCNQTPASFTLSTTNLVDPGAIFKHTFNGLCLGTRYSFVAIAANNAGSSALSSSVQAQTFDDVPSAPTLIVATALTTSSIKVNWTMPLSLRAGTISHFDVRLSGSCNIHCCCGPEYACRETASRTVNTGSATSVAFSSIFTGLCPSTDYRVVVTATNHLHTSPPSLAAIGATLPGVPSAVQNVVCNITKVEPYVLASVAWQPPRIRNGEILYYVETIRQVTHTGENTTRFSETIPKRNSSSINDVREILLQSNFTAAEPNQPRTSLSVDYLIKWHVYQLTVTTATAAGTGPPTVVICKRGWNATAIDDIPEDDNGGNTTVIIVVVVVVILLLLLLIGIAFVLRREGKLPCLKKRRKKSSTDSPDMGHLPLTENEDTSAKGSEGRLEDL